MTLLYPDSRTFLAVTEMGHFYEMTCGRGAEGIEELWVEQDAD